MIEQDSEHIVIEHQDGLWTAEHAAHRLAGPQRIQVGGQDMALGTPFHVDDVSDEAAVASRPRAYRKGGVAVVSTSGRFPFGRPLEYQQTCRYAGNHVRVTVDIQWPRDTAVQRHLGLGGVVLPGEWKRFFCVPPALHQASGTVGRWERIPTPPSAGETMIGHWHRPPLALVFERADGAALELGTGSDLWRWESAFGAGLEGGSYKVLLRKEGIQIVREPLMCCSPHTPVPRPYRLSWYMAWRGAKGTWTTQVLKGERRLFTLGANGELIAENGEIPSDSHLIDSGECIVLDVGGCVWPAEWRRSGSVPDFIRGTLLSVPCWHSTGVQKAVRRAIRQLKGRGREGQLLLHGL